MDKFSKSVGNVLAVLLLLLLVGVVGCIVGLVIHGLKYIWGPLLGGGLF